MKRKLKAFLILLPIVISILACCIPVTSEEEKTNTKEEEAITAAKSIICNVIEDPSSATWNSAEVVEKDDYNRYLVKLDVTVTNKVGGRDREYYYVVVWDDGENWCYKTYMSYWKGSNGAETAKDINDWNQPFETK